MVESELDIQMGVSVEITEFSDFRRKFKNTQTGEVYYNDQVCAISDQPKRCAYCKTTVTDVRFCTQCGAPI